MTDHYDEYEDETTHPVEDASSTSLLRAMWMEFCYGLALIGHRCDWQFLEKDTYLHSTFECKLCGDQVIDETPDDQRTEEEKRHHTEAVVYLREVNARREKL